MNVVTQRPLVLAVAKGRILNDTLKLLAKMGVEPLEDPSRSRLLYIPTNVDNFNIIIVRSFDVPTYVERGAADMGVVGKDVLLESGCQNIYEPLDLKFSYCRLMLAGIKGTGLPARHRISVASKFTTITRNYFASKGIQAEVVKLYGSMELAPTLGLAEYIVDLVDSGKTLASNNLEPLELIMESSARLIINQAAMKIRHPDIKQWIHKFDEVS